MRSNPQKREAVLRCELIGEEMLGPLPPLVVSGGKVDLVILDGRGVIALTRGHLTAVGSDGSRGAPMGRNAPSATKSLELQRKSERSLECMHYCFREFFGDQ
jgi:hypothetical protein